MPRGKRKDAARTPCRVWVYSRNGQSLTAVKTHHINYCEDNRCRQAREKLKKRAIKAFGEAAAAEGLTPTQTQEAFHALVMGDVGGSLEERPTWQNMLHGHIVKQAQRKSRKIPRRGDRGGRTGKA